MNVFLLPMVLSNWALTPKSTEMETKSLTPKQIILYFTSTRSMAIQYQCLLVAVKLKRGKQFDILLQFASWINA